MKSVIFMVLVIVGQWIGWPQSSAPAADALTIGEYVGWHVSQAGAAIGNAPPEQTWEEYRQHRITELMDMLDRLYRELATWKRYKTAYLADGDQGLADFCQTYIVQTEADIAMFEDELMDLMGL